MDYVNNNDDDELKLSSEKTLSDSLLDIGKTALAVSASAAFLYRAGGTKYLSKGFDKTSRFLSQAHSEISSRSLEDWNIQEMKTVGSNLKRTWRQISDDIDNQSIGLRTEDNRTFFGLLGTLKRIEENSDELITEMYNAQMLISPTLEYYKQNFQRGSDIFEQKINNFVRGLATKIDNNISTEEYLDVLNLSDDERDIAELLIQHMSDLNSQRGAKANFRAANQKILDQVAETAKNLDELEATYGSENIESRTKTFFDTVLNDNAATIGDLLANRDAIRESRMFYKDGNSHSFEETMNALERLRNEYASVGVEQEQRFLSITPDVKVLRKNKNGDIYSFKAASKTIDDILDFAAGTLPGKILKLRDIQYTTKAPVLQYIGKNSFDPILSALTGNQNNNSAVSDDFFRIMNKVYKVNSSNIEHISDADNTYLVSGRYGTTPKLLKQIMGDSSFRKSDNYIFRILDINQSGEDTVFKNIISKFNKFGDNKWRGNRISSLLNPTIEEQTRHNNAINSIDRTYITEYLTKADTLNSLFSKNSYELSQEAIRKMIPNTQGEAREILTLLQETDDERLINSIMTPSGSSIGRIDRWINKDLIALLNDFAIRQKKAVDSISLKTDRTLFMGQSNETSNFYNTLRTELGKEVFLKHSVDDTGNIVTRRHEAILELIQRSGLIGKERHEAKKLGYWAAFQDITSINSRKDYSRFNDTQRLLEAVNRTESLFNRSYDNEFYRDFRQTVDNMVDENISSVESYKKIDTSIARSFQYNDYIHMQKAIGVMDIIRSLNDKTKTRSTVSKFAKQFFAGRKDPENITTATLYPYFAFARLSDEMNKVGLGFSKQSISNVTDFVKNIVLKRVAPVGVAYTYFDWANDTVGYMTGTSMTSAFINGVSNIDLTLRKVTDVTGLTGFLKDEKQINPAFQYWAEKDPYQSYDERKEYYENGYDPVRNGRFWTFGGVNEFRGSQIAYWEPNLVRRSNSNYADKALYDGYFDKWSHSLLPTPSNPFSPILSIIDPYWLEDKYYEDRPYPLSGKMFSEGTPWGIVLNATVGEIIKPQKEIHKDRLKNGTDIKALIYTMNKQIFEKAKSQDNQNIIIIKGGQATASSFTAYNAPTESDRIQSYYLNGNELVQETQGEYGTYEETSTKNYNDILNDTVAQSTNIIKKYTDTPIDNKVKEVLDDYNKQEINPELSTNEKIQIKAATNSVFGAIYNNIGLNDTLNSIKKINNDTIEKSKTPKAEGVFVPEKMVNIKVSKGLSLLDNAETIDELMHTSSHSEMIHEAELSARLITGIYGYAANRAFDFGDTNNKTIATASDINSPFRSFWDSGYAGFSLFGTGEIMEISRRFIPDFKRSNRINPLMNTMPDWIPERFRFGDGYTVIPKGEMRLPGKGYESLNELHSDQFGKYGAFDRFKILADIAPYSPEYKIWKQIAQKTIMHPELKKEIKKIKERVSQQGKKHDFYDYKFLGQSVNFENVTVEEVLERGKFKIYGSDNVYKLAGVKLKSPSQKVSTQQLLSEFIHPGQSITIAVDSNEYHSKNKDADKSINAAVFLDGENLSNTLKEQGLADTRKGDTSAAAIYASFSSFQRLRGKIYEAVSHLDLPLIHDQWLRIRSPLESYKAEQIYGTPYQTWSSPIDTFLKPAYERAISDHTSVAIGEAALYAYRLSENIAGIGPNQRKMLASAALLANRGAFIGASLGYLIHPEGGKIMRNGARLGSMAMLAGHLYTGLNDPITSMLGFGHIAYEISEYTKHSKLKSVSLGAAIGLSLYAGNTSISGKQNQWIPDRTKKRWEMQEYFDRLTYIKYRGLYNVAVEKALEEENIDLKRILKKEELKDKNNEKIEKELLDAKAQLKSVYEIGSSQKYLIKIINEKLEALNEEQTIIKGGKYTQSAILYKQAYESTIYGMNNNVSWANIIRALPRTDREYFLEFVKESDPQKREEILQISSPQLQRVLKQVWGMQQEKMESNDSYFKRHNLPSFKWEGWLPDVNLDDIQIKTITNEGMQLTDFGFYESQLRNPDVINAPNLSPKEEQDSFTLQLKLQAALHGWGLSDVDVSVQPSQFSGVEVIANVAKIIEYNIESVANDIFKYM